MGKIKRRDKMLEDNVTVKKILDKEALKDIADKIVGEDIDHIIVIYRDIKTHTIQWGTTMDEWSSVIGSIDMANNMIFREWHNESKEDEDG
jgi:hypothetical protein